MEPFSPLGSFSAPISDQTRMDPLRRTARRSPDAPAVVAPAEPHEPDGFSWSFQELDRRADLIAKALVGAGAAPGDCVAMRLPPSAEAIAVLHGVSRAGAVLVPLNPEWPEAEAKRGLAAVSAPKRLIETREQVREWLGASLDEASEPDIESSVPPDPAPGELAVFVLTSGSTGVPRPVGITHANLAESAQQVIERLDLRASDRWLTSLSPAHVGGLTLIHRAGVVGCALVTSRGLGAVEIARLIDEGEITHTSLVPTVLKRILDQRGDQLAPASLRCLLVGGAAVPRPLLDRALALEYPIALTYGMTETTSQVATATPRRFARSQERLVAPFRASSSA